ncbi:MAG: hypothetical protein GY775_19115 [Candidatus Scalindua sp.]|nr:hypothetical protein [Candidatus Scalindua sp.]
MAERLINIAVDPLAVNNVASGSTVSQNTGEVLPFTLLDGTTDPGSPAGTIVIAKTFVGPVLSATCDRPGQFFESPLHSSISFVDGVIIATQEKGFVFDPNEDKRITLTAEKLTEDGDWAVDYETGLFVIRKATAAASLTLDYCSPSGITGAGGPTSDVNIAEFGGSPVSLGQTVMAGSIPVAIASDQSAIPFTIGANTTVIDGTGTLAATGVPQQAVVASIPAKGVIIQNTSVTNTLQVGNVGSQNVLLYPSDSVSYDIDDVNKLYVVGTAADTYTFAGTN